MSESNETLTVTVQLKELDIQRANFWFQFTKWSTKLLFVLPAVLDVAAVNHKRSEI